MINPNGAVGGNSQNTPTANVPRTRSTFPLKYHFFNTHRFGEYVPHYVEDSVKNDVLPIRSSHEVRSYTLKSPLLQNITRSKDYFSVPMEAILPLNWEKFFVNPVRGDDVLDDVGPSVENFWNKLSIFASGLTSALNTLLNDSNTSASMALQASIRWAVLLEYFYSNGSLLSSLGCHGAPYVVIDDGGVERSFDYVFDKVMSTISNIMNTGGYFTIEIDGYMYNVSLKQSSPGLDSITLRHALSLIRDNCVFAVRAVDSAMTSVRVLLASVISDFSFSFVPANVPLNLSRVWAYQLVCSHYYSNDHIDFVYSAELYRQLIFSYINRMSTASSFGGLNFSRNGYTYRYDSLSAYFCTQTLNLAGNSSNPSSLLQVQFGTSASDIRLRNCLGYFSAVFAYRRSLRYQDYFTGSRSQPLAVAGTGMSSTNVPVQGNSVSVIDVTRSIQAQRFVNAVNRVRHSFDEYLKGVFGGELPAPDYHNPFFLAHTDDTIFGQETENTASEQMNDRIAITTNLRSNGSRYMFEMRSDRPCVIIGITHYDLPRVYSKSMERHFLHLNRFDMFNPFYQFIGDQPIYIQELGIKPGSSSLNTLANFSYTLRNMEYKQKYNQCAGGFVENLPGWIFLAVDRRGNQATINPDWIRSVPSEVDEFFVSLTGFSNGSYFHFIVDDFNDVSGSRPMAYAPSIL